jgi:hypothetical protein
LSLQDFSNYTGIDIFSIYIYSTARNNKDTNGENLYIQNLHIPNRKVKKKKPNKQKVLLSQKKETSKKIREKKGRTRVVKPNQPATVDLSDTIGSSSSSDLLLSGERNTRSNPSQRYAAF